MTHVRAVRKIVGAEFTHKDGIEERRLVGRSARRVEFSLMRAVQRSQMLSDQGKGVIPRNRDIFIRGGVIAHRFGQATLHFEPVIAPFHQFRNSVLCEELPCHTRLGRLVSQSLCAVFTEFERFTVIGVRKSAARTLEATGLIHREQAARTFHQHALFHEDFRSRSRSPQPPAGW